MRKQKVFISRNFASLVCFSCFKEVKTFLLENKTKKYKLNYSVYNTSHLGNKKAISLNQWQILWDDFDNFTQPLMSRGWMNEWYKINSLSFLLTAELKLSCPSIYLAQLGSSHLKYPLNKNKHDIHMCAFHVHTKNINISIISKIY